MIGRRVGRADHDLAERPFFQMLQGLRHLVVHTICG